MSILFAQWVALHRRDAETGPSVRKAVRSLMPASKKSLHAILKERRKFFTVTSPSRLADN
ncbi:MAG: hypothetical protein ABW186_07825 [Rhodanobacteraceae bacterium]